ncbi:hypothetical protein ACMA1D_29740 [Streptomyces sp. 796.1]|uniref:hypothetical protein n=1 Tax=Streptomyces sp. 796.1 TaxID=3163029 RepID=UPI0039C9D398
MNLAELQVGLLALLKSRELEARSHHPYFQQVRASERLSVLQEISGWWRSFAIERACPLTSALLKKRGVFDDVAGQFAGRSDATPFPQRQAAVFLTEMGSHGDPLIAAVARCEGALLAVKAGHAADPVVIDWQHAPYAVLESLLLGTPLDEAGIRGAYRMVVSRDVPELFSVTPLP